VTLTVTITSEDGATTTVWDNVSLDPTRRSALGSPDSLKDLFAVDPSSMSAARSLPIVILAGDNMDTGRDLLQALAGSNYNTLITNLANDYSTYEDRTVDVLLSGVKGDQRP